MATTRPSLENNAHPRMIPHLPQWMSKCHKKSPNFPQIPPADTTSPVPIRTAYLLINRPKLLPEQPLMLPIHVLSVQLARIANVPAGIHHPLRGLHTRPRWTANSIQIAPTHDAHSNILPRQHAATVQIVQSSIASSPTSRPSASSTPA